jgi:hypothetical protein
MLQPAFNQGRTLTTGDLFTRQHLEKGKKKKRPRRIIPRTRPAIPQPPAWNPPSAD